MQQEGKEKLIEIMFTVLANVITIGRYLEKVPQLIDSHISEKEIKDAKAKFEEKEDDYKFVKALKSGWNGLVQIGTNIDKLHLPSYFNSSSLLLIFAMLEDTSRELGKAAKKMSGSRLSLNDIYEQNDVKKTKVYLEKHIGIEFTEMNEQWRKIDLYTQVRNCIIHRSSKVNDNGSKSSEKLKLHLEQDDRIDFEEGVFTITDAKYVEEFLEISQEFLQHIIEKLMEKYDDE